MLLAGDIGGTNARLALYRYRAGRFTRTRARTYSSQRTRDFPKLLKAFLASGPAGIEAACFGVPGPVSRGKVKLTNLDWSLTEDEIRNALGIDNVRLVNDLVATAASIPHLNQRQLLTLHEGRRPPSGEQRCVVLAPGTGLGQAFLVLREDEPVLVPSEGGHADFAPTSDTQIDLLRYLKGKQQRVTFESVLSGPGLENIYDFLMETRYRNERSPRRLKRNRGDRARAISQAAMSGRSRPCLEAMEIFVSVLGTHAGNLALTFRANGGVYLGGGIPPKIQSKLRRGPLLSSYLDKGERMSAVVRKYPLRLIRDDTAALLGAAALCVARR
jgi:glucokinase